MPAILSAPKSLTHRARDSDATERNHAAVGQVLQQNGGKLAKLQ